MREGREGGWGNAGKQASRQAGRQTGRDVGRQTGKEAGKEASREGDGREGGRLEGGREGGREMGGREGGVPWAPTRPPLSISLQRPDLLSAIYWRRNSICREDQLCHACGPVWYG